MTNQQSPEIAPLAPELWALGGWPLGASVDPLGGHCTTFAVFAVNATRVQLEIYPAALGADASFVVEMAPSEGGIWRAQLAGVGPGDLYAFRCWGRNWPYTPEWTPGSLAGFGSDRDPDGNHFHPNKVWLDPYAREITHVPLSPQVVAAGAEPAFFATGGGDYRGQPRRSVDTGRFAPKAVVVHDLTDTGRPPAIPAEDAIIYEAHLKQFSMHPAVCTLGDLLSDRPGFAEVRNVPAELRGTYAGAALLAPYLRGLGITTLELLPIHETDSDQVGAINGTTNNWGYQTIGFFAPNRDYAHDKSPGGPTREFKQLVKAYHDAGIEIYLDVVYNHTAEGGNWDGDVDAAGFTCLGGFATTHYYDLDPQGFIMDGATGSANQTNFSSRVMCDLVMDSLIYWHDRMGVDGFRFDLATVLGRSPRGSDQNDWGGRRRFHNAHPLLREVAALAADRGIEVIAEAWDLWGYEVGNFPSGWGEWNGRFRDAMRRYLKGDGNAQAFIESFNGDWLHFNDNGGPQKSINFITAHDGFTMFDLVSFNQKENNQPYPFGPSDGGSDENNSWDSGGDHRLRRTRWRNNLVVLMLARGVPMIVSGDEYGRTQNGNNNPWNLNTIGIWNNWAQIASNTPTRLPVDPNDPGVGAYFDVVGRCDAPERVNPLFEFARFVTGLRGLDPTLRQNTWGAGQIDENNVNYLYYRPDLFEAPGPADRQLAVLINGAGIGGTDYLVMVNMHHQPADFRVPDQPDPLRPGLNWRRIIDTAPWAESQFNSWAATDAEVITEHYIVEPWSIAVLAAANPDSPLFTEQFFAGRIGV